MAHARTNESRLHLDPPTITTRIRTLVSSKNTDVFLECLSIANPPASFIWLDNHRQQVVDDHLYTIRQENQSSTLAFSTSATELSKVIYYCQSNNSIGTVEQSFDVSGECGSNEHAVRHRIFRADENGHSNNGG